MLFTTKIQAIATNLSPNIYSTKPRELVIKSRMLGSYVGIVLVEEYVKSWTIFHATGNYLE
jgi:hypothetical protein